MIAGNAGRCYQQLNAYMTPQYLRDEWEIARLDALTRESELRFGCDEYAGLDLTVDEVAELIGYDLRQQLIDEL